MRYPLVAIASLALAVVLGAGLTDASGGVPGAVQSHFSDMVFAQAPRSGQQALAPSDTSGGTYRTANGETVRIYAADAYLAADPFFNQRWADLLGQAPHGSELSRVTIVFMPLAEVQSVCGGQALACYSGRDETIVAPGEDPAPDVTATSVLLHEYGHHIARNRVNAPWLALDFGTKRWASHESICRGVQDGMLHPGDEEESYRLNPGEAFAETYRVLAERTLGLPTLAWTIVSSSFYPDETALAAAREDVLNPWVSNTSGAVAGAFRGVQKQRGVRIATPYDGNLALTLRNRTGSKLYAQLVNGMGKVLTASAVGRGRAKKLGYSVCGERSLQLRLRRSATGAGSYSVTISKP